MKGNDPVDSRSSYSEAMQASYAAKVRRAHLVREIIEVVLLIGIIVVAIKLGVESFGLSDKSTSMSPALSPNQNVIVSKLSYILSKPQRGDVIVYEDPLHTSDASAQRIQRIIGIPGDTIVISPTSVTVNGHTLVEPYATVTTSQATGLTQKLGKDQYFVMNDNRSGCNTSINVSDCFDDSRNPNALGVDINRNPGNSLDLKYIVGKVVFVYWPLNKMHGVDTFPDTFKGL
jgi:signal peptidase I